MPPPLPSSSLDCSDIVEVPPAMVVGVTLPAMVIGAPPPPVGTVTRLNSAVFMVLLPKVAAFSVTPAILVMKTLPWLSTVRLGV